jgi:hypothetical protein
MLADHTMNAVVINAFNDYEALRRAREHWLRLRVGGERELIAYLRATHPTEFPPAPAALPELRPMRTLDMRTLLLPQALNMGWLTERGDDTSGGQIWEAMRKYDAALMLCMHACFQVTSTLSERSEGPMDPAVWALHRIDPVQPLALSDGGIDRAADIQTLERVSPVLERAATPPQGNGISVLRELFAALMPHHLAPDLVSMAWETTRDWARTVMDKSVMPVEEKASWIIAAARAGLLSHFVRGNTVLASMFPDHATFIYEQWDQLNAPYAPNAGNPNGPGMQAKAAAAAALLASMNGEYDLEAAEAPQIIYDRLRRAGSVFYAPVIVPLVVASACVLAYLRAFLELRILPGTETPNQSSVRPRNVDPVPYQSAHGMRALTTYTLARLHATLADAIPHIPGDDHAARWRPRGAEHLVGKTLSETAQNLLRAWQDSQEHDRRKWTRALQAGLMYIAGTAEEE